MVRGVRRCRRRLRDHGRDRAPARRDRRRGRASSPRLAQRRRLIGAPVSYGAALALESLLFAARSLGFFAPNALGVQEGAYALLAPLIGLDIADALALSLVKRARDIVIGAPALLLWQRAEAARLWRKR
jgi:hypothetical protein